MDTSPATLVFFFFLTQINLTQIFFFFFDKKFCRFYSTGAGPPSNGPFSLPPTPSLLRQCLLSLPAAPSLLRQCFLYSSSIRCVSFYLTISLSLILNSWDNGSGDFYVFFYLIFMLNLASVEIGPMDAAMQKLHFLTL